MAPPLNSKERIMDKVIIRVLEEFRGSEEGTIVRDFKFNTVDYICSSDLLEVALNNKWVELVDEDEGVDEVVKPIHPLDREDKLGLDVVLEVPGFKQVSKRALAQRKRRAKAKKTQLLKDK